MADSLTAQERLALITDNLQEVLKPDILEDVIVTQGRPLVVYWGTATTGKPHCGYFVPMVKLAQFLRAGCKVKILLADIHAFLDNMKAPMELVKVRTQYYRKLISSLLRSLNVPVDSLEFVVGSSFQLKEDYSMDKFRSLAVTTEHDARKAGSEVVKQVENATLSGLVYPLMQALDEEYLGVDAQFGGVDQRKIFTLAASLLPKLGYKERIHLMNPMVPGLAGGKMSSSDPDSKIDLLDPAEVVKKKVKKAYAVPKNVEGNGIISFVQHVLLPVSGLKANGRPNFVVERREDEGPSLEYDHIRSLKADYAADRVTPQSLKASVTAALVSILEPIQKDYRSDAEWQKLEQEAYPPPVVFKKQKKPKDKGTRHPGGAATSGGKVEAKPDGSVEGPGKEKVQVASGVKEALENLQLGTH